MRACRRAGKLARLVFCRHLNHGQVRLHGLWALAFHDLLEPHQRPLACPRLLVGLRLPISNGQHRLDLDQLAEQRLGAADSAAFGKILQSVDHKVEPPAGDHLLDAPHDLVRRFSGLGHGLGFQHKRSEIAGDRLRIDDAHIQAGEILGGGLGGAHGTAQLPGRRQRQ